jgi:ESS family glutamate:Na+ symporter
MEFKMLNGLLIVKLSMIQTVALAIIVYYLGIAIRKRIPFLIKHSIPAPVVGGLLFASLSTFLRTQGIVGFELDSIMQNNLMIMFFTTIGMGASVLLIKHGGLPLVIFFGLACMLAVFQNAIGILLAEATGIHPLFGIIAGAVTLMGGLGTGGAFGPLFESWGLSGATTAAVAAATFGMVAGSLMGGPFGEKLIKHYRIKTPASQGVTYAMADVTFQEEETKVTGASLMSTLAFVLTAMGLGAIVSYYFTQQGATLPPYIGAMLVAALIRNIGDLSKKFSIDTNALEVISDISLGVYLTMAINGLKLWELLNLAGPLLVILIGQCVLMILFCWLCVYLIMGRDYEAMMLSVGMVGFGMGATPNALANMQVISRKYGPAPKAYLIVPLVGAFLVDFVNALIITGMSSLYR